MFSILSSKKEPAAAAPRPQVEVRPAPVPTPEPVVSEVDRAANPSGRKARRVPAASIPVISGLRISPRGIDASLVNISSTGLLAACGERLQTGAKIVINVDGTFVPSQIAGSVVRNYVASVSSTGSLVYHVAVAFTHPIRLDVDLAEGTAPISDVAAAEPAPAVEPTPVRVVRNRW